MKKIITLIVSVAALCVLGWYVMNLIKNKGKSDTELIEFAIEDVESINKVIITEPSGRTFEIVKNDSVWTDKNGGCIQQEGVGFILDAFTKIEFKGYLPEAALKKSKIQIASQHIKVEIFQNGEWLKTWYIGPSSQDHYGQVMQLDSRDEGTSDFPVIMKIKGTHGIISPRFYGDARKWMCTNIFSLDVDEISKVEVNYISEPARSFSVEKNGADMKVFQQGEQLQNVDTAMIFRYLNNYKKIHFNKPNYVLNPLQIDSLKRTTPFAELRVDETNGNSTLIKCFRIKTKMQQKSAISIYDINQDHFWAELPSGQIVKCQYFVFNPLLFGHVYFPMDESEFKTVDGFQMEK